VRFARGLDGCFFAVSRICIIVCLNGNRAKQPVHVRRNLKGLHSVPLIDAFTEGLGCGRHKGFSADKCAAMHIPGVYEWVVSLAGSYLL
jgi:hypothetical protein